MAFFKFCDKKTINNCGKYLNIQIKIRIYEKLEKLNIFENYFFFFFKTIKKELKWWKSVRIQRNAQKSQPCNSYLGNKKKIEDNFSGSLLLSSSWIDVTIN